MKYLIAWFVLLVIFLAFNHGGHMDDGEGEWIGMKESEYRAFVKDLKWMVPIELIDFSTGTVEVDLSDGNGDTSEYEFNEIEFMQFSGLCDKKGKNIYEGDIIRYSTDPFGQKGTFTYSVIFAQGQFRTERSTLWAVHLVCEVIGNIYENPELLEDKTC